MSISEDTANKLLVKCGRHCCICRRFAPLHLQIHHIVEESEGGSDNFDNLILVCLTCHSDIHTHTKLTRRFTIEELKMHRDTVIEMVSSGKLRPGDSVEGDDSASLIDGLVQRLVYKNDSVYSDVKISPNAIKLLLDAAQKDGLVKDISGVTNSSTLDNIRKGSKLKDEINCLEENGLLDYVSGILYRVSHKGFLLADNLISLADTKT